MSDICQQKFCAVSAVSFILFYLQYCDLIWLDVTVLSLCLLSGFQMTLGNGILIFVFNSIRTDK